MLVIVYYLALSRGTCCIFVLRGVCVRSICRDTYCYRFKTQALDEGDNNAIHRGNYYYRCKTEALVCVLRMHARYGYRKVQFF